MVAVYLAIFMVVMVSFILSVGRFLNCLVVLENFNILLLLFIMLLGVPESHMVFITLMVVSTIEVVIGLVVLTRLWDVTSGFPFSAIFV